MDQPRQGPFWSRYQILEQAGTGAMGVVYRCLDTHLNRHVAVKTLHSGLVADDEARKLAQTEALTLSSLNHVNIGTIHDFVTEADRDFLVMEYIEGVTLEDKLKAEGPLRIRDVIRLGVQLLDGLTAAHGRSVVHRDIKPGNLRVTPEGNIKILDFGVAGLLDAGRVAPRSALLEISPTRSTVYTTAVAGTIPYMSPERVRGAPADARSDVYAAGVVLYEMATGRHPFPGQDDPRLVDRILNEKPWPPRKLNRRVPAALQKVVFRALEKDPARRYQTAVELRADLERIARFPWRRVATVAAAAVLTALVLWHWGGAIGDRTHSRLAAGSVRSIAILPFADGSLAANSTGARPGDVRSPPAGADGDLPGAALAGELASALSRIDSLRVIAPVAAAQPADAADTPPDPGRALGSDAVVNGRIERRDVRIRAVIELVETRTGRRLRHRVVECADDDIAGLSRLAASAVLATIGMVPAPDDAAWLARPPHIRPAAYLAYLRGRQWLAQSAQEGCPQSIDAFERAVALDSSFTDAYAALARACYGMPSHLLPAAGAIARARVAVEAALERDPAHAEALAVRACIQAFDDRDIKNEPEENWRNTSLDLERSLLFDPGSALARRLHVLALVSNNRYEAAASELHRAWELEPFSPHSWVNALWPLYDAGKDAETIAAASSIVAEHPEAWDAWLLLGESLRRARLFERSEKARSEVYRRMRWFMPRRWLGCAHVRPQAPGTPAAPHLSPGDLIFADLSACDGYGAIIRLDPDTGAQVPVAWGGRFAQPSGVALTARGEILALDSNARVLLRIDPATGEQTVLSLGQLFESPTLLVEGPAGEIFVSDWNYWEQGSVIRVDPKTGRQSLVAGGSLFANAIGIAIEPSGDLIVADNAALGSGALFRVKPGGGVSVLSAGGSFVHPMNVAIAADGQIYVADYDAAGGGGAILSIDPSSGAQKVVASGGVFVDPWGLTIGPDGALWVADACGWTGEGKIVRVDPATGKQVRVYEGGAMVVPLGMAVVPGGRAAAPSPHLIVAGTMRLLSDAAFDDITIEPSGTLTADARLTVNGRLAVAGSLVGHASIRVRRDLVVQPGGLLTHTPHSLNGLKVDIGGELEVQSGGSIDVDGRGLLGGYTVATQRAGETFDDSGRIVAGSTGVGTGGAGGSHGGRGGDGDTGSQASAIYDDVEDPGWLGSGGASGGAGGGNGGGRVTIRARACTVDGAIRANGTPGVRAWSGAVGGAGAGGSIRIEVAAVLAGSGVIQADGAPGMCGSGCGGAGGGGRVAIDCGTNAIPAGHITAAGGRGGVAGSAGTVHIRASTRKPGPDRTRSGAQENP